ncbi:penicillin acylase family protein [Alisedimentitalea sp. MJ-SS2]|uniref:penicillin acylase family protein n=1 Tax=Aliisedimentitalea sp. MJ-SS2 TaxID=3049795 RepID=UPI00290CA1D6|nr:penicillin acylase family protein [Alisedimentitalea sp. MJ-SS2]MDU8929307.1 penicillin acylase family protein [Alisedimentitalea sp. MJ-SS2]
MRWIRRIAISLALVVVVTAVASWAVLNRSVPDYGQSLEVTGLDGPVEIIRTDHAVPHVLGGTDQDVFFGLGYAHAQDRFWQMEMLRRTARGRLSELVGTPTIATDELLLRLDLYTAAQSSLEVQTPYARKVLEAYANGINTRIDEVSGPGALAPEFLLFPVEIEPWTPTDSLAILKLIALQLASQIDKEVTRARVAQLVPPERLVDILPDVPGFATFDAAITGGGDEPVEQAVLYPASFWNGELSSNAWAAGPARSVTGASILANDPHLNFAAPSIWYLARIELEAGGVIGGTIPGIPMVLSGRSDVLAWGLTAANMDDQDVFVEKLNPENAGEVLTPEGYTPLVTRQATIPVRGQDAIEITLRWSENGPVIPAKYYNFDQIRPEGHVIAIARTLFNPADTSMSAALEMLKARNVGEALAAMEGFVTPAQNLSVVDADSIALQMIGKMPKRTTEHETKARLPSRGWIAGNRWYGYLPYADNPRFVDPGVGVLGNTNNKTADGVFPRHVSFEWGDSQRIMRLQSLLATTDKHSLQGFQAMQMDPVSHPAQVIVPLVAEVLGAQEGRRAEAVAMLLDWDGAMDANRPEPAFYAALMRALQVALSEDELGDVVSGFRYPDAVFIGRVLRNTNGAGVWCDDVQSAALESCAVTVGRALDQALDGLQARFGDDLTTIRWGEIHVATHDHQVLGGLPVIGALVNIRQETSGGDATLLRGLTHGKGEAPLRNLHGALYRGVYDMAAPETSVFVVSTGQSGHPMSRHYRDQAGLWLEGKYLPMVMDVETLRAEAAAITRLTPVE